MHTMYVKEYRSSATRLCAHKHAHTHTHTRTHTPNNSRPSQHHYQANNRKSAVKKTFQRTISKTTNSEMIDLLVTQIPIRFRPVSADDMAVTSNQRMLN